MNSSAIAWDAAVARAMTAFHAACEKGQSSTVHPVDDFMRCMPAFNLWRREFRSDTRFISRLRVSEARELFLDFATEHNERILPLHDYQVYPGLASTAALPSASATRAVAMATYVPPVSAFEPVS